MKKISLIALLASSLLIAGCGGADTASRGNATVTVTEQTQLSELENAIIQAEAAMASGDARSAVTLLESHTGDAKAAELYNTAKQEALRAQLCGSWTMTEEPSLEGSYITITYNENGYTAVFGHASDNYLGYKTGEVKWKDITLGENGTLAFTDIIKTLSGVVEEQSISVAFDMDTTQIIYEYDLPERSYCYVDEPLVYTKITDEQAQQLSQQYSEKLNITYTGVPIMRDSVYGLSMIGVTFDEASNYGVMLTEYSAGSGWKYGFVNKYEFGNKVYGGTLTEGAMLTENIYCGMTSAQFENAVDDLLDMSTIKYEGTGTYSIMGRTPSGLEVEIYYSDTDYDWVIDWITYSCPTMQALQQKAHLEASMNQVHEYTHTFTAPKGWTIVPDYSDAIRKLNNGEQPTSFKVECYWRCPLCGTENWPVYATLDYKYDSTHYLYEAHCRMSNCYYRNYNNGTAGNIKSYATQIS